MVNPFREKAVQANLARFGEVYISGWPTAGRPAYSFKMDGVDVVSHLDFPSGTWIGVPPPQATNLVKENVIAWRDQTIKYQWDLLEAQALAPLYAASAEWHKIAGGQIAG